MDKLNIKKASKLQNLLKKKFISLENKHRTNTNQEIY